MEAIIDNRGLYSSKGYAYYIKEGGGLLCIGGIRGRSGQYLCILLRRKAARYIDRLIEGALERCLCLWKMGKQRE